MKLVKIVVSSKEINVPQEYAAVQRSAEYCDESLYAALRRFADDLEAHEGDGR